MKYINKSILLALTGLSIFAYGKANAQEIESKTSWNVIKFNPIPLAGSTMTFAYERVLNNNISLELTGNFTYSNYGNSFFNNYNAPTKGWGLVPELRYYPLNHKYAPPEGFFIGPFFRFQQITGMAESFDLGPGLTVNSYETMTRISIGGDLGYQWMIENKVSIELFMGPAFDMVNYKNGRSNDLLFAQGDQVGARAGFTVGIAF